MTYKIDFDNAAFKEWKKLGETVRQQLKKKLAQIVEAPRIEANRLHSLPDCYKIKLRASGYRLVYKVEDETVVILVLTVGKRERLEVYKAAATRLG
uniref:mRNA interferase RelE n=1 Tax=Pectobacterium carotovorum TaxID=554 RepID=A0A0N9MZ02_PECCA|nr:type II toxin-antitoxin system RelE/ParE family toxin [Pectobacterium carotovorum]ALG88552.1 mRNA interferase RelE [Pectobacterium carotovorum]